MNINGIETSTVEVMEQWGSCENEDPFSPIDWYPTHNNHKTGHIAQRETRDRLRQMAKEKGNTPPTFYKRILFIDASVGEEVE